MFAVRLREHKEPYMEFRAQHKTLVNETVVASLS